MAPNTKKIIRIVAGALLAIVSLLLLTTFIYTCVRDNNLPLFTLEKKRVNAPFTVLMWLCILGTGAPAALLLLRAFRGPKESPADAFDEDDEDGDDNDDDEDDYAE